MVKPTWKVVSGGIAVGAAAALVGYRVSTRDGAKERLRERRAAEAEARAAAEGFFQALNSAVHGDISPMDAAWSHADDVTLFDPFGGWNVGWRDVHGFFRWVAQGVDAGQAVPRDLIVTVDRDLAYASAMVRGSNHLRSGQSVSFEHRITNVLRREGGQWKLAHVHADLTPDLAEAAHKGEPHHKGRHARPSRSSLLDAANAFYHALNRSFTGDLTEMDEIWAHTAAVSMMDPFGGRQTGWGHVRREFAREAGMGLVGRVDPVDVLVRDEGDMGYVLCWEQGEEMALRGQDVQLGHRATSVFRREGDTWRMVHHHTDLSPELQRRR